MRAWRGFFLPRKSCFVIGAKGTSFIVLSGGGESPLLAGPSRLIAQSMRRKRKRGKKEGIPPLAVANHCLDLESIISDERERGRGKRVSRKKLSNLDERGPCTTQLDVGGEEGRRKAAGPARLGGLLIDRIGRTMLCGGGQPSSVERRKKRESMCLILLCVHHRGYLITRDLDKRKGGGGWYLGGDCFVAKGSDRQRSGVKSPTSKCKGKNGGSLYYHGRERSRLNKDRKMNFALRKKKRGKKIEPLYCIL